MNILMYKPLSLRIGYGAEYALIDLANAFSRIHDIDSIVILTSNQGEPKTLSYDNIERLFINKNKIKYIEYQAVHLKGGIVISTSRGIERILSVLELLRKEDTITLLVPQGALLEFAISLFKRKTKMLIFEHHNPIFFEPYKYFAPSIYRAYIDYFRKVLCKFVTAHRVLSRKHFVELRLTIPQRRIFYIPNGINLNIFKPIMPKNDVFTVIYIGKLVPAKGFDIMLRVILWFLRKGFDVQFVVVGTGNRVYTEMLKRIERKAPSKVVWYSYIENREQLARLYASSHVFVTPSRQETFGLTSLEAMACGTPVIATRISGPEDFVIDGITGYLIEPHHDEDILTSIIVQKILALKKLWEKDYEDYRQLCENALKIAAKFNVETIAKIYYSHLKNLLSKRRSKQDLK